jgi:hypothetical protein
MEMIGSNHGHTLTVPPDHVTAGTERTYTFAGTAPHMHSVTVTAANFTALRGGGSVTVTSTSGGDPAHTHSVTITCA